MTEIEIQKAQVIIDAIALTHPEIVEIGTNDLGQPTNQLVAKISIDGSNRKKLIDHLVHILTHEEKV